MKYTYLKHKSRNLKKKLSVMLDLIVITAQVQQRFKLLENCVSRVLKHTANVELPFSEC
jgi:hypothetical protein